MASTVQHSALTGSELHEPKGVTTASAGEVYVADGSNSGAWGDLAAANVSVADSGAYFTGTDLETVLGELGAELFVNAYGELYITNNTTAETATGGAVDWTTNWVAGLTSNTTLDASAGSIEVTNAGTYELMCALSIYQSGASSADWLVQAEVNGVASAKTGFRRTTSAGDVGAMTLTGLLTLSASDVVTISVTRNSGSVNPIINYANFSLTRIA